MSLMYMQSCIRRLGSQVRAVNRARIARVARVNRQAPRVPLGMFFPGDTSSPDMLAPAMMPVTPENRTPNTTKKLTCKENKDQCCKLYVFNIDENGYLNCWIRAISFISGIHVGNEQFFHL